MHGTKFDFFSLLSFQKQPYGMGPGNRPMQGGQMMGPRGPPPGMGPQQYQQQSPNVGQFNQMMPQNRPNFQGAMPPGGNGMGPNSMQYQDFGGNMGSNPMGGNSGGGGGNMMQGGMMGPNMGPQHHPNMMGGPNMPTTSSMGRNPGINPNIPRPNLMASQSMGGPHGPSHGPSPGHLTRSLSMPVNSGMGPRNSMSPNQFPMQGNASGGQYPGRGGGTPNQMMTRMPNSSMPQNTSMGMSNPMATNTSMTQSNAMGNQWGGGGNTAPSTAGQTSQQMYPTPVTTQAPSMGQDMFPGGNGGMNRGNMDYQGMMGQGQQQRGPGNQNTPVTSQVRE